MTAGVMAGKPAAVVCTFVLFVAATSCQAFDLRVSEGNRTSSPTANGSVVVRNSQVILGNPLLLLYTASEATIRWQHTEHEDVQYSLQATVTERSTTQSTPQALLSRVSAQGPVAMENWTATLTPCNSSTPAGNVTVRVNFTFQVTSNRSTESLVPSNSTSSVRSKTVHVATTSPEPWSMPTPALANDSSAPQTLLLDIVLTCSNHDLALSDPLGHSSRTNPGVVAAIVCGVLLLLVIMAVLGLFLAKKYRLLDGREPDAERKLDERVKRPPLAKRSSAFVMSQILRMPSGAPFQEVPTGTVHLGKRLGRSAHCDVFMAIVDASAGHRDCTPDCVAAKILKDNDPSSASFRAMRAELEQLQSLGHHEHIVSFYFGGLYDGYPCLILEFMPGGDLHTYLRRLKTNSALLSPDLDMTLSIWEVLDIGLQIARAMDFLATKKIVHRQLMARSVLVREPDDDMMQVKLSDIGVSRHLLDDDAYINYAMKGPSYKWMATESVRSAVFSSQTDVWSFGMVLWEVVTCGKVPFDDIPNGYLLKHLESGGRPLQPLSCVEDMYRIMKICWHERPSDRVTFEELVEMLKAFYDKEKKYASLVQKERREVQRSLTNLPGRTEDMHQLLRGYGGSRRAALPPMLTGTDSQDTDSIVLPAVTVYR